MIDLQGPHWLVSSNLLDPEIEQDSKLLRVLAEIVKIEISILLHDALSCAQGELAIGPEISQVQARLFFKSVTSKLILVDTLFCGTPSIGRLNRSEDYSCMLSSN